MVEAASMVNAPPAVKFVLPVIVRMTLGFMTILTGSVILPETLVLAAYTMALSAFSTLASPGLNMPPTWKVAPLSIREEDCNDPKD